jgi:hypothetical protein
MALQVLDLKGGVFLPRGRAADAAVREKRCGF